MNIVNILNDEYDYLWKFQKILLEFPVNKNTKLQVHIMNYKL